MAGAALDHEGECATGAAPYCSSDGGAWVNPDGTTLCAVDCAGCRAECLYIGTYSEGWYAVCIDATKDAACFPWVENLIEWTDCSP
jgi:hypothetical protein